MAGRAALVPAGADPGYAAALAAKAGATLVVVYGDALPGGGIGLDEGVTVPVVTVPGRAGRDALDSFRSGRQPLVSVGRARGEASNVDGAGGALLVPRARVRRLRQARSGRARREPAHGRSRQSGRRHCALLQPERLERCGGCRRGCGRAARPVEARPRRLRSQGTARGVRAAAASENRSRPRARDCSTSERRKPARWPHCRRR